MYTYTVPELVKPKAKIPPTSTYRNCCASLCRSMVEFSLRWRSFVRMNSSSQMGRSILQVSWESASCGAGASSCSITEAGGLRAFQRLFPQSSLSSLIYILCHFPGIFTTLAVPVSLLPVCAQEKKIKVMITNQPFVFALFCADKNRVCRSCIFFPRKYLVSLSNIVDCVACDLLFGQRAFYKIMT